MLFINEEILTQIYAHGEAAYPEEGAGFLLGSDDGEQRHIAQIFVTENAREDEARHNRYLVTPQEYLQAEIAAEMLGLSLIGVFHSHPDHPNRPSEFDREWAQPFFSYIITSVNDGKAVESRSWRLAEDRSMFEEEKIISTQL
ncbi:MAG: M67 family metallopeptidase [Anaerolineales bacterium]|nr:M67 family metallopeptidase [Anaerolineales bacterium]